MAARSVRLPVAGVAGTDHSFNNARRELGGVRRRASTIDRPQPAFSRAGEHHDGTLGCGKFWLSASCYDSWLCVSLRQKRIELLFLVSKNCCQGRQAAHRFTWNARSVFWHAVRGARFFLSTRRENQVSHSVSCSCHFVSLAAVVCS